MTDSKIIVALDLPSDLLTRNFAHTLDPKRCRVKIGKEAFTRGGPALVEYFVNREFDVFLDLKFHDIPNTVANACREAANLGVWMMNIHASGGSKMIRAAVEALNELGDRPLLVAVTVLTSMGSADLREIGMLETDPQLQVSRLADLAEVHGCDGVVCSAQEAKVLRSELGNDFLLVTPGIRPATGSADDQVRITTPRQAIENGASYLVVGRPITQASDPMEVVRTLFDEN